jgi:endo-alpha-1,4-polygalactosaminidase (GH114 family)
MVFLKRPFRFFNLGLIMMPLLVGFEITYLPFVEINKNDDIYIISPYAQVKGDISRAFAYISLCEIEMNSGHLSSLPPQAIVRKVADWTAFLVDISSPEWEDVIKKEIEFLRSKGFENVFVDTADNVEILGNLLPEKRELIHSKGVSLIRMIKKSIPGNMIINRGFGIYDDIKNDICGVFIESLFYKKEDLGWTERTDMDTNTEWLLDKVEMLRRDKKMILAVDYAPMSEDKKLEFKEKAKRLGISWKWAREDLQ